MIKAAMPCCSTDFEGYCEDETVRVVMSGNQEPRGVDFTEEALEQGSDVSVLLRIIGNACSDHIRNLWQT